MVHYRHLGWYATAILLIVLSVVAVSRGYVNHDAAWYLHMASVWFDGGTLYRDVVDTNPPLIVFLTAIPVWIARALGISQPPVFKAVVLLAAAVSVTASLRPIWRTWESTLARGVMSTLLVFGLFSFVAEDFGQREHFAAILVAPFVLEACAAGVGDAAGRLRSSTVGFFAGLGFAVKPHFVIAWIGIEVALGVLRPPLRPWRRPAALGVVGAMVAYAAAVVAFAPSYLSLALEVIPLYAQVGLSLVQMLLASRRALEIWTIALVTLALVRLPSRQRAPTIVLFVAATGFLVAALVQLKAWDYQFYPYQLFGLLFAGSLGVGVADAYPAALEIVRGGSTTLSVVIVALLLFRGIRLVRHADELARSGDVAAFVHLIESQERHESLALLSTRFMVAPYFPAVTYEHVQWTLRHNGLWFLAGFYREELKASAGQAAFHSKSSMGALERKYFDQIVDDLCAQPPRLLVMEPYVFGARELDLLGYYQQDARFDRLLAGYRPIPTEDSRLALYARGNDASCK